MRTISDAGLRREARALRERVIALARRRSLRDPVAASCGELELTPPQIHALLSIGHDGPLTMGALARRVAVTEKTVTGIVDRLERDGHLRRERDTADRRVVRARLTPRGEQLFRRIDADIEDKFVAILGALDPADRKALARIVDQLVVRLGGPEEGGGR
jgi:DNA-binding MarR family transcriptional regulator